jgi:hypothetical protein
MYRNKIFCSLLIIFGIIFFGHIVMAVIDENDDYKVDVWQKSYRMEYVDGIGRNVSGIFSQFYQGEQIIVDEFQINTEEYNANNGYTRSASKPYITISENNKIFVTYLNDSELQPVNKLYGRFYDINGQATSEQILLDSNTNLVYKIISLHDRFFLFYRDQILDYSNYPPSIQSNYQLLFRIYDDDGQLIQGDTLVDQVMAESVNNNVQIVFGYDYSVTYKSLRRVNQDQLIVGWYENNYTSGTETKYARIINHDGTFDGSKFIVEDFSYQDIIEESPSYPVGTLLAQEGVSGASVYYVGEDNKKYVFPDQFTYFTWYENWDDVVRVSVAELDAYDNGGVVTYRPGSKLITTVDTAHVYALEPGGSLRLLPDEATASNLYGVNWSIYLTDVAPDIFTQFYTEGEFLSNALPTGTIVKTSDSPNVYYIDNGSKRLFPSIDAFESNNFKYENILEIADLSNYPNGQLIGGLEDNLANFMP